MPIAKPITLHYHAYWYYIIMLFGHQLVFGFVVKNTNSNYKPLPGFISAQYMKFIKYGQEHE